MENLLINSKEIEQELKSLENEVISLEQTVVLFNAQLSFINYEIEQLFSQIKSCENIESAQKFFDVLDKIQSFLATVVFKNGIKISDRLHRFVKDFDNLPFYKDYYFNKIRSGEYSF